MKSSQRTADICAQVLQRKSLTDKQAKKLIQKSTGRVYSDFSSATVSKQPCSNQKSILQLQQSANRQKSSLTFDSQAQMRGSSCLEQDHQGNGKSTDSFKNKKVSEQCSEIFMQNEHSKGSSGFQYSVFGQNVPQLSESCQRGEIDVADNSTHATTIHSEVHAESCKSSPEQAFCTGISVLPHTTLETALHRPQRQQGADQQHGNAEQYDFCQSSIDISTNSISEEFLGFVNDEAGKQPATQQLYGTQVYFFDQEVQNERQQGFDRFFEGAVEVKGTYLHGARYSRKPPSVFDGQIPSNLPRRGFQAKLTAFQQHQ